MIARLASTTLALACVACAPAYIANPTTMTQGTIFEKASGPLSYESSTARDVGRVPVAKEAKGEACQYGVLLPTYLVGVFSPGSSAPPLGVVWGDGGYAEAMRDAQTTAGAGRLHDVRADMHTTAILGVFVRRCLEVHAAVAP